MSCLKERMFFQYMVSIMLRLKSRFSRYFSKIKRPQAAAYKDLVVIATAIAPSDAIAAHRARFDFRILRKLDDEVEEKRDLFHQNHLLSCGDTKIKGTGHTPILTDFLLPVKFYFSHKKFGKYFGYFYACFLF